MSGWQRSHFIAHSQVWPDAAAHFGPRAMQICLELRYRRAGDLRDLLVAPLLKNLEREDQPLVFVQRAQRFTNDAVQLLVEELIVWRHGSIGQLHNPIIVDSNLAVVFDA